MKRWRSLLALVAIVAGRGVRAGELVLNEVVALNQTGLIDDRGNRPDWIELHNPGPGAVDLTGWSISDDAGRPRQWTFRSGQLAEGGFLVVYASGEDRQPTRATAVDPEGLGGRVLHLRASTIEAGDPTQVRRSGEAVFLRRWPDLSAARREARQGSETRQPRWLGDGTPRVRFDGTDDLLTLTTAPGTNDFTLFAVVLPVAGHEVEEATVSGVGGTSGQRWLFGAAHGGDAAAGAGMSVGTNGVSAYEHGSGYMPARAVAARSAATGPLVAGLVYRERRPRVSVDGTVSDEQPVSSRDPVRGPTEIGAGAYGAFAGDVLEIVGFDRALTEAERAGVERFLAARYGVTWEGRYHAAFRIDAGGERLVLTRPDGTRADDWRVPAMPRDVAYGRPGGGGAGLVYFAEPSPGLPNPRAGATDFLAVPRFSMTAGFHAGPVSVAMASSDVGVQIRYTLDGSEPTAGSALYGAPLVVTNRTPRPNAWSAVPTAPGWQAPAGLVFKGTVVRARAFRSGALPSEVATASYFVDPRGAARYPVPVVSLATAPGNFFDPDRGIYVVGNAPGGNYAQTGDAWERPVHVEFFETNGVRVLAQEAGLRMHGNTSFGFPLKGLRLHARNQRGTGPFRHRIFPDLPVDRFDRLLLRPSGHDQHLTMMRDGLMQGLVRELGLDVQGYRPAVVFVDGEYWGIHNLQEALEKNYFAAHHPGVDAEAVDYLEGYSPGAYAYEGDTAVYDELVQWLRSRRIDEAGTLAGVEARMETGNFRDYKLAEMFHYRWDIGNHRLWRPRVPGGRLRWILFDCDVGFGGFWSEPQPWAFDMLEAVLTSSGSLHGHNGEATVFLLSTLLGDPGFRRDFIDRALDLLNGTLSSPRILGFIDRMASEIEPLMAEHTARWRTPASLAEWRRNVEALRTFARLRPDHVREHLRRRFGLGGPVRLSLAVNEPGGGRIRCNTVELAPATTDPWTGIYLRDRPVRLEAIPAVGWRFAGWAEIPGETRVSLAVNPVADLRLTARFEREPGPRLSAVRSGDGAGWVLRIDGVAGRRLRVETSTDLRAWTHLGNLEVVGAVGSAVVPLSAEQRAAFFRVVGE